ncbi:Zinc-finger homeodomain protein [Quillaja saponaria]|uniref:Zinc-finger homeodomain protein n=1 Tax=Quillaja saponaria TaxID=32244 RepID=A0AAD7M2W6_QUISA|nr:Zinc-finger homeodomain protein [Quillaja saponaria]
MLVLGGRQPDREGRQHPGREEGGLRQFLQQEQKERLLSFAQRLGWRYHYWAHEAIEQFCEEMGIERRGFMMWLGNNRKRQLDRRTAAPNANNDDQ